MSETKPKPVTVDEYMATIPQEAQAAVEQLRQLCKAEAPEASEVISYAIPAYKLPGQGRGFVYISGYTKHVSIYPVPHNLDADTTQELAPHVAGKGTLHFSLDKPLPVELIKKVLQGLHRQMLP